MKRDRKRSSAFTIIEIIMTMLFVAVVIGPILNAFTLSKRMGERGRKSFLAQNLAREMMSEISRKPFYDPDGNDTESAALKPGPTHEEYIAEMLAKKMPNGTDETSFKPRLFNETILDRRRYYDDIDDYDGYNSEEVLLPTLADGREYLFDGENVYKNFRVGVKVVSDNVSGGKPQPVLNNGGVLGPAPASLAFLENGENAGKYAAVIDSKDNSAAIVNLAIGSEIDNGPSGMDGFGWTDTPVTNGRDRINLSAREVPYFSGWYEYDGKFKTVLTKEIPSKVYELGSASKIILGPAGDRFYALHRSEALSGKYSGVTAIDMNIYNTPEVSFHKVDDVGLIARDIRSNSINSITVDAQFNVFAATNGGGLMKSTDNGESWEQIPLEGDASKAPVINFVTWARYTEECMIYACGKGGLWISSNANGGKWTRNGFIGSTYNMTAAAVAASGYMAAGSDDGTIFAARNFGVGGSASSGFILKNGPAGSGSINSLTIGKDHRVWAATPAGLFYSDDLFSDLEGPECTWNRLEPKGDKKASGFNFVHIDGSRTYRAPFIKVLKKEVYPGYSGGGVPFAPSMIVNDGGIYLFYLDNRGDSTSGLAYENMKLCYTRSKDFGVSWSKEKIISSTPSGATAWAHSEVIDNKGCIHVVWNENRQPGSTWKVCYQKSSDGGNTWLSNDKVITNRDGSKLVYDYKYKNGELKNWTNWGSDYFKRIDCSNNNLVQAAYSVKAPSALVSGIDQLVNMLYSHDGGKTWFEGDGSAFTGFPITYYQAGYFIDNRNYMFSTTFNSKFEGEGSVMGIKSNVDGSEANLLSGFNGFSYNPVSVSMPPVFNREKNMLFVMKSYHNVAQKNSLDYLVSKSFPYGVFNGTVMSLKWPDGQVPAPELITDLSTRSTMTSINPEHLYKSQISDNRCYIFSGTPNDSTVASSEISGRVFMTFSRDSGISRSVPLFIDYRYGDYDSLTSAEYGSTVYILKKSPDAAAASNFYLSSFPEELVFAGTDDELMTVNPGTLPLNEFERNEIGEKANCFAGDDEGNMLYGTSTGLYIRNIGQPNAIIDAGGGENVKGHIAVNFPVKVSKYEKFPDGAPKSFGWQKFFDKICVTSVYAEKGGVYWVGTADRGIFRTTDRGANWTHIESKMSDVVDIGYIAKGPAAKINKLDIFSRRFNLRDPENKNSIVSELVLNVYDLSRGVVESSTLIARDKLVPGTSFIKAEDSSAAVCSDDGSRIACFDAGTRKIFIKKIDRSYNHFVQKVLMEFINTGVVAEPGDSIEVFAGGMLMTFADIWRSYLIPSPVFYPASAENDFYAGKLEMKIGAAVMPCFQHSFAEVTATGEIYYRIKSNDAQTTSRLDANGLTAGSDIGHNGYFMVKTIIRSKPVEIGKINASVAKLVFAPDGKTIYAISTSGNRVYEIKNFEGPGAPVFREYSKNVINPFSVIFSHPTVTGNFKTYIVCSNSIVDLSGNKFFDDGQTYNITDAAVDIADNVIFIDGISKKMFKCSRTAEKTVYVTVSENDSSVAGGMPPLIMCKKFYSGDVRESASSGRDFIKYEYVYSSKQYPDGINSNEQFTPEKFGDKRVMKIYVIDSHLKIKAPLEIAPGTIVKFSTADKQIFPGNYSGRSGAGIKVEKAGKLYVMGNSNEDEHVLFTSIDDNSVPPTIYNAPDGEYRSGDGLPNAQLRRTKADPANPHDYKNTGGPCYGDWGVSDGTDVGSFGGIHITDNSDMSVNYLDMKYGLFYTGSLYPDGTMPRNFSTRVGIYEWKKTNVFVLKDSGPRKFEVVDNTFFKIDQGTIVKAVTEASLNLNTPSGQSPPYYSIIVDGSPRYPVNFAHVSIAWTDGRTPNDGMGFWKGISANGSGEVAVFRNARLGYFNDIDLKNRSNIYFNGCTFGNNQLISSNNYNINSSIFNSGDFYNCDFYMKSPGKITANIDSSLKISESRFNLYFDDGADAPGSCFIRSLDGSVISMDGNHLVNESINDNTQALFNGPKLRLESTAYITNNVFKSLASQSSAEIYCMTTYDDEVWPVISGNEFRTPRTAITLQGYEGRTGMLSGRITNNDFSRAGVITRFEPYGTDKSFYGFGAPLSLAGGSDDRILIGDELNKCLFRYSPNGELLGKLGDYGKNSFFIGEPTAIASNYSGEVYIVDSIYKKIKKINSAGSEILDFGRAGWEPGMFQSPSSIALLTTATAEMVFVGDKVRNMLMRFDSRGNFIDEIGGFGRDPGQFDGIAGLASFSASGTIYAADQGNNRIQKIVLGSAGRTSDYFDFSAGSYSVSNRDNNDVVELAGFSDSRSAAEGEYIQLLVRAVDPSGKVKTNYASSGTITIAETGGAVRWEGPGITGTGNSVKYDSSSFFSGAAVFYVSAGNACQKRTITITDSSNPAMRGSIEISWTPESPIPGAVCVGVNGVGFRRYRCVNDPGVTLIKIPASNFDRGDSLLGIPAAEVKMSSYYISETSVTNRQFKKWRDSENAPPLTGGWKWSEPDPGGTAASAYPEHPAVFVSWADAKNYSYWLMLGYNTDQDDRFLPTEAQYEKAARGPKLVNFDNDSSKRIYPWGTTFDPQKCNEGVFKSAAERPINGQYGTTPVLEYPPQGHYDLYDIAGNVYCWCRDGYTVPYKGVRVDPLNYAQSETRVIRGGSFDESDHDKFKCSFRSSALSGGSYKNIGFRVGFKK